MRRRRLCCREDKRKRIGKRMRRLFAALFALLAVPAFAQESIKVETPGVVGLDEQFNVTFIIEGESKVSDFSWEPGNDFQLVWGPQRGTSTSINMTNGKTVRSVQSTYTYIVAPKAVGKFQMNAATAKVDGKQVSSTPPSVEVVVNGSSSTSRSSSSSSSQSSQQTSNGDISSEDLFMRFTLSRSNVVIGEPITATLKLYQRVNVAGFEDAKFPTFNGFWSQETESPTNIEFQRESYDGRIYNTAVLRKYVLIPQQSGQLKIDPAELVVLVNVRSPRHTSSSIFDSFFDDGYRTIRKRVTTPAVTVNVKALPAGAPASFGGGVGSFTMEAKLSKDALKTHEAASLEITVSGKGNVALLEAPKINFPPDFEVYDAKTSQKTDKSAGGTTGSKTFEYPFIPRSHGDFTIGPVEYSYYDVNAGRYVTLTSSELVLSVEKGSAGESSSVVSGGAIQSVERKGVKNLGEDIRFISTKTPSLNGTAYFFVASAAYWVIVLFLALLAVAVWFALRQVAARRADVAGARNRGATKMARRRLKAAGDFLERNLYTAFYEELHKALLGFASDKLYMGMEDLDKDKIAAKFTEGGVAQADAERFSALLDACEYARYSPDSGHEAMSAHYEEAVSVISTIDSGMKGKKSSAAKAATLVIMLMIMLPMAGSAALSHVDSLWTAGVNAYNEGLWDVAEASWESIRGMGVESEELCYNIGNAYFREGYTARAILFYERALKINPSYSEAKFNLEFANSQIQDRIDPVPEFMLKSLARKISYMLGSNAWAVLSVIFLAGMLMMLLIFLLAPGRGMRKTGFFASIALLVLALMSFGFAKWQKADYLRHDEAIVMNPVSSVKSSPSSDGSRDLFVLHEGTKVSILDEVGGWKNIELSDGRQGWIRSGEIEVI